VQTADDQPKDEFVEFDESALIECSQLMVSQKGEEAVMQKKSSTREAYGRVLVKLGKRYPDLVVLDADLSASTKTRDFAKNYPERFFDMGIAEQNMMGTAAGFALAGKIPCASTFAVFATGRAYDQVRNAIAYPGLNVKIIATHAGVSVGEDGASHQTIEDISLMRTLPNMTVIVPADAQEAAQVVSIITTTGYSTADFNLWPYMSQALLVMLMFVGGCSGSTSGSIKVGRILILLRQGILEIRKLIHPRAVFSLKIGGKNISNELVSNVMQFFFLYVAIFAVSGIAMTAMGLDLKTSFTSVAATFGNVGPGLGLVGPAGNYSLVPGQGKLLLSFLMLLGRLEIYTVFVMFSPSLWE
jgi:hypothetical protein